MSNKARLLLPGGIVAALVFVGLNLGLKHGEETLCGELRAKARAVYVCANTRGCAVQQGDLEALYAKAGWFQEHCRKEAP